MAGQNNKKSNKAVKEVSKLVEETGYTFAEITKGYTENSSNDILGGAVYINYIAGINKFNSNEELVEYLETKKNIKVIKDLPSCLNEDENKLYLDTTENKEKIKKAVKEKYNFIWDKLLQVVERKAIYEFIKRHKEEYKITDEVEYTILKPLNNCKGYRYRNEESIYMTLGENEYYRIVNHDTGKNILKDAVESNLITIKESEFTEEHIIYTK